MITRRSFRIVGRNNAPTTCNRQTVRVLVEVESHRIETDPCTLHIYSTIWPPGDARRSVRDSTLGGLFCCRLGGWRHRGAMHECTGDTANKRLD